MSRTKKDETMKVVSLNPRIKHPPDQREKTKPLTDLEVMEWHVGLLHNSLRHLVERPADRPEILAWIMAPNKGAFSFIACATMLGADPDQLRLDVLRAYVQKTGDLGIASMIRHGGTGSAVKTPTRLQQAGAG